MGRSTRGARSAPHHRRGPVDARFRRICRTAREALRREFSASGPAPYLFHHRRMVGRDRTRGRLYIGLLQLERREREFSRHMRSEEHTSELQSLMRISYAVFCLKKTKYNTV